MCSTLLTLSAPAPRRFILAPELALLRCFARLFAFTCWALSYAPSVFYNPLNHHARGEEAGGDALFICTP